MNTGEPPGRSDLPDTSETQPSTNARPVAISVSLSFREATHTGSRFLLKKPLEDSLHDATVMRVKNGNDEILKKTIAVMQGVTTLRDGDSVNYKARISVSPDHLETVEGNVRLAVEDLVRRFKAGFSNIVVNVEPNPKAGVELSHEAPPGHDERGQNDGDPVGAEISQA
jgi:hypothetical protein